MKQPFFFLLFVSGMSFGQNTPGNLPDSLNLNLNLWKDILKEKKIEPFQKKQFLLQNLQQEIPADYSYPEPEMEGRFSHSISDGAVYLLPIDHMSCMVPDLSKIERMLPSMQFSYSDGMPISGPRYRLNPPKKFIK